MSTNKHIDVICWAVTALTLIAALLLLLCPPAAAVGDGVFSAAELDGDWSSAGADTIDLSRADGDVYISTAGRYVLSGRMENGSVIIDADGKDAIFLKLDSAGIHNETGAALRVEQAGQVILTLAAGTENRLSSGVEYAAEAADSGVDGTIYSRDDLCINGSGSLIVESNYKHGIVCNDTLSITGGIISVTAVKDAIHANDAVRIAGADLTLDAGDDAVTCKNDEGSGEVYIASGSLAAPRCYEGLEGDNVTIVGGSIALWPSDDGINAMDCITVSGGELYIENSSGRDADGLDSNGDIRISGGKLLISVNTASSALDCGSENGGKCIVSGGTVVACGGSGMAEGFDSGSPQGFVMNSISGPAGCELKLKKADGTTLISTTVPCAFTNLVLSAPGMQVGDTCVLTIDDRTKQLTVDNQSTGGMGFFGGFVMPGGMQKPAQEEQTQQGRPDKGQRPGFGSNDSDVVSGATPTQPGDRTQNGMQRPDEEQRPEGGMQFPGFGGGNGGFRVPEGDLPQLPEGTERPDFDRTPNGFPGQGDVGGFGGAQRPGQWGKAPAEEAAATSLPPQTLLLLGASVLVLAAGLVFAMKKKY